MRQVALGLAIFFYISQSLADAPRLPRPQRSDRPSARIIPLPKDRLTFERLQALAEAQQVSELDALLFALSKHPRYRKALSQAVLLYYSRGPSRRDVTASFPAILFFSDGFFAKVTGDPDRPRSYQRMEVMEYDAQEEAFRFHQVDFREPASQRFSKDVEYCNDCHQGRPIWASYPVWPGTYPSLFQQWSGNEKPRFDAFRASLERPALARYRYFMGAQSQWDGKAQLTLTLELSRLNFRRIQHQMEKSKAYPPYRFAVYAAALECPNTPSYLPFLLRRKHEDRLGMDFSDLLGETLRKIESNLRDRLSLVRMLTESTTLAQLPQDAYREHASTVARLRYLIDGQSLDPELNVAEWSMARAPGEFSYSYANGDLGLEDWLDDELLPSIRRRDPLTPLDCVELKRLSLGELEALR